jgi:DNA-binding PadR family transcriptional regulator
MPLGHLRTRRFFEKGVLRFVVLELLSKKPSHGYEIIRALEERSRGLYSPSPGSIYPTLQQLQDSGYVTFIEQEGKKVYTITEAGSAHLAGHADILEGLHQLAGSDRGGEWLRQEFHETASELRRLGQIFMRRAPQLSREQARRIRDIVRQATREIENVIDENPNRKDKNTHD